MSFDQLLLAGESQTMESGSGSTIQRSSEESSEEILGMLSQSPTMTAKEQVQQLDPMLEVKLQTLEVMT